MPLSFTCPHCGAETLVADEFIGQTGPCAACGMLITIPRDVGQPAVASVPGWRPSAWTIAGVVILVGGLVVLLCAGLLLPAISAARARATQVRCANNMRQLGSATQGFLGQHGRFPTYVDPNAPEGQPTSWRVQLLPYLNQTNHYRQYDASQTWDAPANRALEDPMPSEYRCPGDRNAKPHETSYLAVVGSETLFREKDGVTLGAVTDGLSGTILFVESHRSGVHWMKPADTKADAFSGVGPSPLSNCHPGGANVTFADGSVRTIDEGIDPLVLRAMTTINGDEPIGPP